jgi:lipopolysaccharide/colanic/teichoic acid biosynthesis glycosyltransferase
MVSPVPATSVFSSRARVTLALADIAVLALCAVAIRGPRPARQRLPAVTTAAALTPFSFWLFGLYARTYATTPRDEVYAAALPGGFAVGCFLSLAAIPGTRFDRTAGLATLAAGVAGCAAVRALLHGRVARASPAAPNTTRRPPARGSAKHPIKRAMDLALTIAAAPLATVVGTAVALIIVVDDGGPVFFSQERVGCDGRIFRLYKFRTMRRRAGDAWAVAGDDRITRAGRFLRRASLDELPQLINVVRGEMSLVGPRPEMVSYARDFAQRLPRYPERHRVKPGITGWAQVTLPRVLTADDAAAVLAADLFYVEHCSLALDGAIIAKTAVEVLFHRVV